MKIEIQEHQMRAFLQMAYIGKYVVNDSRTAENALQEFNEIFCEIYDKYAQELAQKERLGKEETARRMEKCLSAAHGYLEFYLKTAMPAVLAKTIADKKFGKGVSDEKLVAEEAYEDFFEKEMENTEIPKDVNAALSAMRISADYGKLRELFMEKGKSFEEYLRANGLTKDDVIQSFQCSKISITNANVRRMCVYLGMDYLNFVRATGFSRKNISAF